jgi:hypothetical protein
LQSLTRKRQLISQIQSAISSNTPYAQDDDGVFFSVDPKKYKE